jgi:hypothetical protein
MFLARETFGSFRNFARLTGEPMNSGTPVGVIQQLQTLLSSLMQAPWIPPIFSTYPKRGTRKLTLEVVIE